MALTQVKTTGIADDAVTEAKVANDAIGITEMKAGTDGHVITYDASGNPTTVGPGTDGQVLTSTGAGSPPAFEDASGTTINNNADNRVITGSGTANTLEGEANLTYDGSTLKVDGGLLEIAHSSCHVDFMESSTTNHRLRNGSGNFHIQRISDDKNTTTTQFLVDGGTGSVELFHNGTKKLSTQSGGICFNSDTAAANALDDYEEGTFTPTAQGSTVQDANGNTYQAQDGIYTKVGRLVVCYYKVSITNVGNNSGYWQFLGLPFAAASAGQFTAAVQYNALGSALDGDGEVPMVYLSQNDSYFSIRINDANGSDMANLSVKTLSYLRVTISYFTDA